MPIDRKHPRYAVEADLTIEAGDQQLRGSSSNLSRGGLCAQLDAALPLGQAVKITIALPIETAPNPIRITGRVVWCTRLDDGYQIGIMFGGMRVEEAAVLDLYTRSLDHLRKESGAA